MASKWRLAGMEVPFISSDSVKWIEVSVSSSNNNNISSDNVAPLTEDCASCSVLENPSQYLIWRIHKNLPTSLELLHVSSSHQFTILGLRINFPFPLSPFAFICSSNNTNIHVLHVLTVSGIAFRLKFSSNFSVYESTPLFPNQDILEFNLVNYGIVPITRVAATAGCLVVGRNDGSVASFQLGILHPGSPGFQQELRDDTGIGRLWGLMSRGRMLGPVQDLVIVEVLGKMLLFVLHSDGIFRVWDLSSHSRIFRALPMRLWVGEAKGSSGIIPFAILYKRALSFATILNDILMKEVGTEMIYVFSLHCKLGDKLLLSLESSIQDIPLDEGACIDVKLTSKKIWILKDSGLIFHNLSDNDVTDSYILGIVCPWKNEKHASVEEPCCYAMQEEFVAEQLFQSSECSSDDLLSITHSLVTSPKDHVVSFVSSIFFRRLLHPGVHHNIVLRATLLDYNRHWTDSEFQNLTVDGLKKEIISLIEHEAVAESPLSIFYGWKNFCTRYFHHWCKNNEPYGLFVQSSTGAVGLLRKNSMSVFRSLESIELLIDGCSDELGDLVSFGLEFSDDLSELGTPTISAEELVPCLLKILETGYSSSVVALNMSDLGADVGREKELANHKNLRKFSIDMLLSLHALGKKAVSWDRMLNVLESYLRFLVPRKILQDLDAGAVFNISTSILVQATSQIAKVMFESALDVLLFISYLLSIGGQIGISHDDMSRMQLEFIPMIQEIVFEWLIILFFGTTPSESPTLEDFSSQLSSLQIGSNGGKRSWNDKLGKCDFTLAFILLLNFQSSSGDPSHISLRCLPSPQEVTSSVRGFTSWVIWGKTWEESSSFLKRSTQLSLILLKHGQYDAVKANLQKEKTFRSIQDSEGDWCVLQHLLGCCLLAQAQCELHGLLKEKKVCEAVRCFFRAASGQGAFQALQSLSHEAGLPNLGFNGCLSSAAWKLHYYQWAMQIFEQYGVSEGACQFALAALEQVDEALSPKDDCHGGNPLNESAATIKGRLWANVFKFTLDLNLLHDAYCAIISNPDEESKCICLRRFIIVLYERKAAKLLCDGQLPFIGIAEKIERELGWKADRSDILAKPNPYELLYAFEMQRHNWRKAASYMYLYSARLRTEPVPKDSQHMLSALQERLNGLSAAINALHLVHPAYAWIDPFSGKNSIQNEHYPRKKAKKTVIEQWNWNPDLESVTAFTLQKGGGNRNRNRNQNRGARHNLGMGNGRLILTGGINEVPSDLVDLLVQTNFYDMAFTVLLKFWKGSRLKRELEIVFFAMSLKCCPNKVDSACLGTHGLLLTSSKDEVVVHGSPDNIAAAHQYKGNVYLESITRSPKLVSNSGYFKARCEIKYKDFHAGLPIVVAETLLRTDPRIELPLWLICMFKGDRREKTWGMTSQESSPASLFRLYVDYGRYTEATNLLLEYIESFSSMELIYVRFGSNNCALAVRGGLLLDAVKKPTDIINRKRPFSVWFPYTAIERLWCQLEELIRLGHMVDQCDKLKKLLHGTLLSHLKLLKVDSDDAISAASS
ncbi:nuclear pore complex protein NUP160 [Citrus sinensis]|nr:nuclear pore complex protein NUP160 [Citrus sinensis]